MAKKKDFTAEELKNAIVEGMQEKRAKEIVALDLDGLAGASTQYFVICHGQSDRQTDSIAKSVEDHVLETLWFYRLEWTHVDFDVLFFTNTCSFLHRNTLHQR